MTGVNTAGYKTRIDGLGADLGNLSASLEDFANKLTLAADVVGTVDDVGTGAGEIRKTIDSQKQVLTITKSAGPFSTASKAYETALDALRPVAVTIEERVQDLNNIGTSDPTIEEGEFLSDLKDQLSTAADALNTVASEVRTAKELFVEHSETVGDTIKALGVAIDATRMTLPDAANPSGVSWAANFTNLEFAVNAQFGQRNDAMDPVLAVYNSITSQVNDILGTLNAAKLEIVKEGGLEFQAVTSIFDVIGAPLEIAAGALEKVQPLFDAAGFIQTTIVQPVFDFVSNTIGLQDLIDNAVAELTSLLPDVDFMDDLVAQVEGLFDELNSFIGDGFGIYDPDNGSGFLEDVEAAMFGNVVGKHWLGPTGYGTVNGDVFNGNSGGDILDGKEGNDTIFGGGGNDIFVASEGDDVLDGGAGTDLVYFDGNFNEYELSRAGDTGPITITHMKPPVGAKNQGAETINGFEFVVFNNIAFTGAMLDAAIIGNSVLNGTNFDDLMFLNTLNDPLDGTPPNTVNGFHVANGLDGNDYIFGSTANDRLNGGNGNDVLLPGLGNDEVKGDLGEDTFQILAGSLRAADVDLSAGTSQSNEGNDTLFSIENAVLQGGGDHELVGSNEDNVLITAAGRDVLVGLGGDDTLDSGADNDVLIGGNGVDHFLAGSGRDILVSTGLTTAGVAEVYDGGLGVDALSFSLNGDVFLPTPQGGLGFTDNGSEPLDTGQLRTFLQTEPARAGAVRIFAETGTIEHFDTLDTSGTVITTEVAVNIENYAGSDFNDIIYGERGTLNRETGIHGGDGDDTLYSNGANYTLGGKGDDVLFASAINTESNVTPNFHGGDGEDSLDLTPVGDARWKLELQSDGRIQISAHDVSQTGSLQRGTSIYSANADDIEEFILGNNDDEVSYEPNGGNQLGRFIAGKGNDVFVMGGIFDIDAGDGADDLTVDKSYGDFYGGAGNDTATFRTTGQDVSSFDGGADDDYLLVEKMRGSAVGGNNDDGSGGYDTIAFEFEVAPIQAGVDVDLVAGTATASVTLNNGNLQELDITLAGFEQIIGSQLMDTLLGSEGNDVMSGRSRIDYLDGRGGDDLLFGGFGSDSIYGGAGNDTLHGERGAEFLDGGAGIDTASYATAFPGDVNGDVIAIVFGNVTANLTTSVSSGYHGSDTLVNIENLTGGTGDDQLTGDEGTNVLIGGRGDDTLNGLGGDDILVLDGDDVASGGGGNDSFVAAKGVLNIDGGAGFDALSFDGKTGPVAANLLTGEVSRIVAVDVPVWLDTGSTEARSGLTPQDVFKSDVVFADDLADTQVAVPDDAMFDIQLVSQLRFFTGSIQSIEAIEGSDSDDILIGNVDDNHLSGGAGADRLNGLGGDDTINAEAGDDTIDAGAGDDRITLGTGDDVLVLGVNFGNDVINDFEKGVSTSIGDKINVSALGMDFDQISFVVEENDLKVAIGASSLLLKNLGSTTLEASDFIGLVANGTSGPDTLTGTPGDDVISLLGGHDLYTALGGDDEVSGDAGNDTLRGDSGEDTLNGGSGNDQITGGNSNDLIDGGTGLDLLLGNGGNDSILGGTGNDTISAGAGNDTVHAGGSNDDVIGQGGSDLIFGDNGADTLRGGSGNDTIEGGSGNDLIFGNGNNDLLDGGAGHDNMQGAGGLDTLLGGSGNDTMTGGDGNDSLDGGAGDDVMNGGANIDRFVFAQNYDEDRINGYQQGIDILELDDALWGGGLTGQQVVNTYGSQNGTGTILTLDFGSGDILEVQNGGGINSATFGSDIDIV